MIYIVGTPIGNLKDVSERMKETLEFVDVIIMESPADSKKLLNAIGVRGKKIMKFNDKNAKKVLENIVSDLENKNAAYITSAGMPTISDPGALLVKTAREKNIKVEVIPGPSAVTTAIAGSGILTHEFTFIGFLPKKETHIEKLFRKFSEKESVIVFFESPFRILKAIKILEKISNDSYVCVAKELTKMFENYFTGKPEEIINKLSENSKNTKGEFTVVVDFRSHKK